MNLTHDTIYWLLSALIQSFAAILSIVGFFVVHHIQQQKSSIVEIERMMKEYLLSRVGYDTVRILNIQSFNYEKLLTRIYEQADAQPKRGSEAECSHIKEYADKQKAAIDKVNETIKEIKIKAIRLWSIMGGALILWIFGLTMTDCLYSLGWAIYFLWGSVVIAALLLIFVIRLIITAIR